LPDKLFVVRRGDKVYYRYRRPDTGEWRGVGSDRQAAIRAAKRANNALAPAQPATELTFDRLTDDRDTDRDARRALQGPSAGGDRRP
jgi:hypothetical protein